MAIWLLSSGCEIDTKGHVNSENPPTIKLSGSGRIYFLRVLEEPVDQKDFWKNTGGIWQIEPDGEMKEKSIFHYPAIEYGVVPNGFIQVVPEDGSPPAPLEEGKTYNVFAPTSGANGGGVRLTIRNGKCVELP
jgi:hypothetical protein